MFYMFLCSKKLSKLHYIPKYSYFRLDHVFGGVDGLGGQLPKNIKKEEISFKNA